MLRTITLEVDDSPMDVLFGVPDTPGPHPGLLLSHHRYGLSPFTQATAERLVEAGFAVIAPNHYHHTPDAPDDTVAKEGMTDAHCINDMRAAAAFLRGHPAVNPDAVAIMGHCMGGRGTLLGAATVPGLRAGAVFYGGGVMTARGEGPTVFERLGDIECPIAGFFGARDTHPSPDEVRRIEAELIRHGVTCDFHIYDNTGHGFMDPSGKTYREAEASDAWSRSVAFLKNHLA